MEKLRFCLGLALALGICACRVGPDYCKPETPPPGGWSGMQPGAVATRPSGPEIPPAWYATSQPSGQATSQPASQPVVPASQPSVPVEPAVIEWWAGLNDPLLDQLILGAVDSNLTLRIATARVLQARAQRDIAVAAYWPQVSFSDSYNYSGASLNVGRTPKVQRGFPLTLPSITLAPGAVPRVGAATLGPFPLGGSRSPSLVFQSGGTTPFGATPPSVTISPASPPPSTAIHRGLNTFQAGFDASWELDVFGGIYRSVEAATDTLESVEWNRRDALVTLLAEVAANYVGLRGAQVRLQIAYQNITTQTEAVKVTRARYEAGFTGELDVAQAQAQLSTTESQVPLLQTQIQQFIYQLSVLLALPPGALVEQLRAAELAEPQWQESHLIPATPPEVPVGLPSDLLRRRPDVRSAERQLASATAQVGVAVAQLFPVFSLNGAFGTQTSDIRHLFDARSLAWSVGPSMSWPFFQGGRLRAQVRLQDAIQEETLANYELVILTALQDVEDSLVGYMNEKVRYESLADAVVANQRATDLATELYARGLTPFLNVLQAQGALFVSEDARVASQTAAVQDLISLYKALGGGWEPSEPCCIDFIGVSGLESRAELNAVDEDEKGAEVAK